ncbi:hypothetical protein P153DRAFT_380987 [Dothidotthia symphoricarpi CBS 119687]|uniref:Rhodopsin domain-containing protein n=1 Tax=Dothidotthia symphoricarpi CBS 119687 TaxID=1392245 RepID=A0A6A6APT9_9PLEO|nr:uncharacterized protein P153DRAFT_380987 [Dothidotthia symphoricarpi CBS 119687]KAF2133810.1 hypothetical protein P153DRAFT_380987 [Dothidotthia symphoricarpi CBS 119687]
MVYSHDKNHEQDTIVTVGYVMGSITILVVLTRFGLQLLHPRKLMVADGFVLAAFACYLCMCGLYISISPYMRRLYRVSEGKIPPYPELSDEVEHVSKMILAAPCMFWMTLWCIKAAFLLLYRKLLACVPTIYTVIWWAIVCICVMTHIGNYALYFRSCGPSISGFWTGGCEGPSRKVAQLASLYYSFAADTSTNIMIMALPMRLTYDLHMRRTKKAAIFLLFASGVVCITVATLRVAQVAANEAQGDKTSSLDPAWLGIWGIVECSIAIIIGCCPAFAGHFNAFRNKHVSHDTHGYRQQPLSRSGKGEDIHVQTIGSMPVRNPNSGMGLDDTDLSWVGIHNSQEELTTTHGEIAISKTVDQTAAASRKDSTV